MTEPTLLGFPISLLFLYFMFYSFIGWAMETCYCSIGERRFVARGFLYGPICPIYGVGVLMMILWFAPLTDHLLLFYVVATVFMSAWEYFVGWFLEVTTHIKYWDYSMYRFHLHGRICLHICLIWGALAYVVIFWIHPTVAGLMAHIPALARYLVAGILFVLLLADATATIRELALVARLMAKLNAAGDELRLQLSLGKAELADKFDAAREGFSDRLEAAKDLNMDDAAEKLREKYNELLSRAEHQSRRLRTRYSRMSAPRMAQALTAVTDAGTQLKARLQAARKVRKAEQRAKKQAKRAARHASKPHSSK